MYRADLMFHYITTNKPMCVIECLECLSVASEVHAYAAVALRFASSKMMSLQSPTTNGSASTSKAGSR